MTRKKSARRGAKRRKLDALREMTVERGCTPDEAATAAKLAAEIEAELGAHRSRRTSHGASAELDTAAPAEYVAPFYVCVGSEYGAPMGRGSDAPEDFQRGVPLHVQMIPFTGGDYDPGGAYWGGGEPIWCVWDNCGHECYRRAWDRHDVTELFTDAAGWIEHDAITCPRCGSESVFTRDQISGQMECLEFVDEDGNIDPGASGRQCHHKFAAHRPKLAPKKRHRLLR